MSSEHSLKVDEEYNRVRLDVYLAKNLPEIPSRSLIKKIIDARGVKVNGAVAKANYKVSTGDEITVKSVEMPSGDVLPENIPLDIFYEDGDILVVNKPVGMMVHPATGQYTGTLVNALLYHCRTLSDVNDSLRPGIVHRLDKETSGLMVIAKTNRAHAALAKQFSDREINKQYVALVEGLVEFDEGKIDAPLGRHPRYREKKAVTSLEALDAKEAMTFYQVLKRFRDKTLIALFPQTGRTHQLRVHMKHLGHPILGDDKYGKKGTFSRLALHARSLGVFHPRTSAYLEFSSRIPPEFLQVS